MDRVILHSDANSFYASVEMKYRPELNGKPVAVCGDPAERRGIVVTKNPLAKKYGVLTGEPVHRALEKCPGLILLGGHYDLYHRYSAFLRDIYNSYTDKVEPYGLDEAWMDISKSGYTLKDGERIAHQIRNRVKNELGITVSVGVSFNKVFAKFGSDYKKPDAVTVITRDNYKQVVWPLPVGDLFYVGPQTAAGLAAMNIRTIGDLACCEDWLLDRRFGKCGRMIKDYANGLEDAPVCPADYVSEAKSIGNSTTTPEDIVTFWQARCVLTLLAESVGARLREERQRSGCIAVYARDNAMITHGFQRTVSPKTNITAEIAAFACKMYEERLDTGVPYRGVGITCSMLSGIGEPCQMDLMNSLQKRDKWEKAESAIDAIRVRFGDRSVIRGIVMAGKKLSGMNPREARTVLPGMYYTA